MYGFDMRAAASFSMKRWPAKVDCQICPRRSSFHRVSKGRQAVYVFGRDGAYMAEKAVLQPVAGQVKTPNMTVEVVVSQI